MLIASITKTLNELLDLLSQISDTAIFEDVSSTIEKALKNVHAVHSGKTGIAKKAFEIALKELV